MQVGRTNRRAFIAGLGGAAAWPLVTAFGQTAYRFEILPAGMELLGVQE